MNSNFNYDNLDQQSGKILLAVEGYLMTLKSNRKIPDIFIKTKELNIRTKEVAFSQNHINVVDKYIAYLALKQGSNSPNNSINHKANSNNDIRGDTSNVAIVSEVFCVSTNDNKATPNNGDNNEGSSNCNSNLL